MWPEGQSLKPLKFCKRESKRPEGGRDTHRATERDSALKERHKLLQRGKSREVGTFRGGEGLGSPQVPTVSIPRTGEDPSSGGHSPTGSQGCWLFQKS